ncbi:MAG: hypothetical protein ACOYJF_10490, partial [Prevotella sp.]
RLLLQSYFLSGRNLILNHSFSITNRSKDSLWSICKLFLDESSVEKHYQYDVQNPACQITWKENQ